MKKSDTHTHTKATINGIYCEYAHLSFVRVRIAISIFRLLLFIAIILFVADAFFYAFCFSPFGTIWFSDNKLDAPHSLQLAFGILQFLLRPHLSILNWCHVENKIVRDKMCLDLMLFILCMYVLCVCLKHFCIYMECMALESAQNTAINQ